MFIYIYIYIYIYIGYIYVPTHVLVCKIRGWFFLGCPAYQSGTGKEGFRIDVSMASQSSSSGSLLAAGLLRFHKIRKQPAKSNTYFREHIEEL